MKNVKRVFILMSVAIISFICIPLTQADAAYSSWKSVSGFGGSCKVRVFTDAATYTSSANTVDAKIEQNGDCGTVFYRMSLLDQNREFVTIGNDHEGSFTSSSPLVKFNINSVSKKQTTTVKVDLYKTSFSNYKDSVWSNSIVINAQ